VESQWELQLPLAANPFDRQTLADVLLTIDYTALSSPLYYREVLQSLSSVLTADRSYSFRDELADAWYDLHNPDQSATPMTVQFTTTPEDFPPNLLDYRIRQVLLYFSRAAGGTFEVPVTHLQFTPTGSNGALGGGATTVDGVVSTRRGNAGSWVAMIGKAPCGTWELALPNTEQIRNWFRNELIEEMLFVVTYTGQTPPWPQ